jgi:glycerol-3-phosphate dehydrogenase
VTTPLTFSRIKNKVHNFLLFRLHGAASAVYLDYKTQAVMLYGERTTVCSEINTRHVNTFFCKKVEFCSIILVVYTAFTGL